MKKLNGSEKQVAWAEDIRAKFVADYEEDMAKAMALPEANTPEAQKSLATVKEVYNYILDAKTEAAWWIEERMWSAVSLVRRVGREYLKTISR